MWASAKKPNCRLLTAETSNRALGGPFLFALARLQKTVEADAKDNNADSRGTKNSESWDWTRNDSETEVGSFDFRPEVLAIRNVEHGNARRVP